ncbi:MAG: hypothetical protein LBL45_00070 [Treponema sp.]|jgi:hypothetical protein|nr:hypothetical protein [Treponema sp.]
MAAKEELWELANEIDNSYIKFRAKYPDTLFTLHGDGRVSGLHSEDTLYSKTGDHHIAMT